MVEVKHNSASDKILNKKKEEKAVIPVKDFFSNDCLYEVTNESGTKSLFTGFQVANMFDTEVKQAIKDGLKQVKNNGYTIKAL